MRILYGYDTNIGGRKINQDAFCIKEAQTNFGKFCLVVICDGMGGFASGEVASSTMVKVFSEWFEGKLPYLLKNFSLTHIRNEWNKIAKEYSKLTVEFGMKLASGGKIGTTLTAALFTEFYGALIMQIGDTRLYLLKNMNIRQVTDDQTKVAAHKKDLSEYDYEHHPQCHVLTECIGGSRIDCDPLFYELNNSEYTSGTAVLMCTDGFRHEITSNEVYRLFSPSNLGDETDIINKIREAVDIVISNGEKDNITAVVLKFV